jgi:uncharacterized protein
MLVGILLLTGLLAAEPAGGLSARTLRKRCADGALADCVTVGDLYERGKGVGQDPLYASMAFRQACDGGNAEGCYRLGRMHERGSVVVHDLSVATTLFEKSCKGGHAPACEKLEGYVEKAEAEPKDKKSARPAVRVGPRPRPTVSCASGNREACYAEALALYFGEGVDKDEKRGRELLKKTCDDGHAPACDSLKAIEKD